MSYFVYILQSEADGSFYIGYTANLTNRLHEHNSGKSYYTRRKMPWQIIYTETYASKSEAIRREKQLKALRNSAYLQNLIKKP